MRNKVLSLGLLCCLIAPVIITAGLYAWQKHHIRKEVKRKLAHSVPREALELFKFTPEQLQTEVRWEHSREFEYRNEMYDVVYREQHSDTTVLWCWWDHAETQLNQTLKVLVCNALSQNQDAQKRTEQLSIFFKSFFFQEANALCFLPLIPPARTPIWPGEPSAQVGYTGVLEPPPDAIA